MTDGINSNVSFLRRKSDSSESGANPNRRRSNRTASAATIQLDDTAAHGGKANANLWSIIKSTFLKGSPRPTQSSQNLSRRASMSAIATYAEPNGTGRDSPLPDFASKDRSAIMKVVSFEEMKSEWREALDAWGFTAPYVDQYSSSMAEECITVDKGAQLDDLHMQELKIKIGHRRDVRQAAAVARRSENTDATAPPDEQDTSIPALPGASLGQIAGEMDSSFVNHRPTSNNDAAFGSSSTSPLHRLPCELIGDESDEFNVTVKCNARGIRWNAVSGGCRTLAEFYNKVTGVRQHMKFPKSFDRAFLDNKPMPFQDQDGVYTLVVLRIPDLTNEGGSTVATISNRLVVMFSAKHRQLLTYHRCDVDPLERLAIDWEDGVHANSSIFQVVDAVNRCVLKVFRFGLRQLQELSDELEDEPDMVSMVEGLTLVQKKAAVYKRCLNAGRLVLEELQEVHGFEDYIPLICETAQSYESMMDEVAENALGSINMQMALDGFHSSRNTKVFTYISLVCQPITLATGWYGMNFVNMPELEMESAYFVFMGIVVPVALFILLIFLYQFEIKVFADDEQHHHQPPPMTHGSASRLSTASAS